MKKLSLIFALACGVFTGCSSSDEPVVVDVPVPEFMVSESVAASELGEFMSDSSKLSMRAIPRPMLCRRP